MDYAVVLHLPPDARRQLTCPSLEVGRDWPLSTAQYFASNQAQLALSATLLDFAGAADPD